MPSEPHDDRSTDHRAPAPRNSRRNPSRRAPLPGPAGPRATGPDDRVLRRDVRSRRTRIAGPPHRYAVRELPPPFARPGRRPTTSGRTMTPDRHSVGPTFQRELDPLLLLQVRLFVACLLAETRWCEDVAVQAALRLDQRRFAPHVELPNAAGGDPSQRTPEGTPPHRARAGPADRAPIRTPEGRQRGGRTRHRAACRPQSRGNRRRAPAGRFSVAAARQRLESALTMAI
ncbi:MAG: MarR family transcriptional regulator [Amycolatopsis sp.]|nr:MarR family transcriptional regulator [Amycolatopsis sp.]